MSKETDLKGFLTEEIKKSGFPLEIEVSSILENQQWVILNNQPFRDPDEDELRSVDILSFHGPTAYERLDILPFGFSPRLTIECKKSSSHAWIFFTRPDKMRVFPMNGQVYDFPEAFSTKAYRARNQLVDMGFEYEYYFNSYYNRSEGSKYIHFHDFERTAIAFQEYKISDFVQSDLQNIRSQNRNSGKKKSGLPEGRNDILEAINQLVKFQEFDMTESVISPGRIRGAASPFFPVELSFLSVVFDGKLFEAIVDKGKPILEERTHLLLHYIYRPRKSFKNLNFWIDIVAKAAFPKYLERIHQDISMIHSKLIAEREPLSQYLRKDLLENSSDLKPSKKSNSENNNSNQFGK